MITRRSFLAAISSLPIPHFLVPHFLGAHVPGGRPSIREMDAALPTSSEISDDVTRYVNIAIGTGGHGHTYPGATVPFGMVQLSPDTYNEGWDWCSGYHYSDGSIMGFSHTHLSGTGVGDMLDVLLMPGTGPAKVVPGTRENPGDGYRSRFSHQDEITEPGYYSVILQDYNIRAELSATERTGIHKYTFPKSDSSHFILDLVHACGKPSILWSELKIVNNHTIVGGRSVNGWAAGRQIYFAMKFSKPFLSSEIVSENNRLHASVRETKSRSLKCLLQYRTATDEVIYVKTGISGVSVEGALRNLETEIPEWNFAKVRRAARDRWRRELSRIRVESANQVQGDDLHTAGRGGGAARCPLERRVKRGEFQDCESPQLLFGIREGATLYTPLSFLNSHRSPSLVSLKWIATDEDASTSAL
jgi:predicted alpha-1,2-mannosidase